jgi:hypothetical protein
LNLDLTDNNKEKLLNQEEKRAKNIKDALFFFEKESDLNG